MIFFFCYLSNTEKKFYHCSSLLTSSTTVFFVVHGLLTPEIDGDFHTQASCCWGFSGKEKDLANDVLPAPAL